MWRRLLAACILSLSAGGALAQSSPQRSSDAPPVGAADVNAGRPGYLTPHEVIDKRLLDFMGNSLGLVRGVSADGRMAIVMPSGSNQPFTVEMSRLSLGMGIHTVVLDARTDLDANP